MRCASAHAAADPCDVAADPRVGRRSREGLCATAPEQCFRRIVPACALLLLLLLPACRRQSPPHRDVVRDTVQRGPLKLVVEVSPRGVSVGDTVTVDLAVETPQEYVVTLPAPDAFGELGARQTDAPEPRPGPTGVVWRRAFALEPAASGPLEIPSLIVKYRRGAPATGPAARVEEQPAENELASKPLTLEVRSALTSQDNPTQPRDITGTLLPRIPPLKPWQWALIVLVALLVAATGFVLYRLVRRRLTRPPPPILPEIWALRALEELAAADWFEDGRFRECYYRLTEIVRGYVERKFALAAPEMTTEEFLLTLARDRGALPYDSGRLRDFLEACDLVKYAAVRPRREDAETVLGTARAFVHATAAAGAADGAP